MIRPTYRSDIDGLRAIAVLSVVLYHFGIGPLHGGFVGVDIFFVISGYLITGIINKEIAHDEFSFSRFYERRVRRIFPALFVMMIAVLTAGVWLFLPADLVRLGDATLATLLFGSNLLFWRQSGYFDTSSEYNPLLHTWSLAVEEQFYIGLPILLLLVLRFAKRALKPILVACMLTSLALCLWMQSLRPSATFFLAPFRAWELLLGSLLAIGAVPDIRNWVFREVLAVVALAVLLGSLWWTEPGINFPGWEVVLPVIATATLLHICGQGESIVQRWLAWRPLVFIGLISYSLYLWHWPLLVYARYRHGMEFLPFSSMAILMLVAISLAWASYRWVETPFRHRKTGSASNSYRSVFLMAVGGMTIIACLALLAKVDHGWQRRFPADVVSLDLARSPIIPYQGCDGVVVSSNNTECIVGQKNVGSKILIWGDSHALAWVPAFDELSREVKVNAQLAVNSACPPLAGVSNPVDSDCAHYNRLVMEWIRSERPDQIFLVASWLSYSQPYGQYSLIDDAGNRGNKLVFAPAVKRTIEAIRPFTRQIILIGPTPGAPHDIPFKLALSKMKMVTPPPPKETGKFRSQAEWFWQVANRYKGDRQVVLVDPASWFCDTSICRYQGNAGELLYRDGGHLSLAGARYVARHFPMRLFVPESAVVGDISRVSQ